MPSHGAKEQIQSVRRLDWDYMKQQVHLSMTCYINDAIFQLELTCTMSMCTLLQIMAQRNSMQKLNPILELIIGKGGNTSNPLPENSISSLTQSTELRK